MNPVVLIRNVLVRYNPLPPYNTFPSWKWRAVIWLEKKFEKQLASYYAEDYII